MKLQVFIIIALFLFPAPAHAEKNAATPSEAEIKRYLMKVGYPRSSDTKNLILSEEERGIIEVHLASDGCMLDGYPVSLVDESRRRVLKTLKSDETGILTFSKVPPGVYTVMVRHTSRTRRMRSTVRVGDVLLGKAPIEE